MHILSRPKFKIDFISFFICGLLILPLILKVLESLNFFPTQYVTYVLYGVLWLCLGLYAIKHLNRFLYISLIVLTIAFFFCTMESLVFPDNNVYIWGSDLKLIVTFVPHNLFGAIMFVIPGLLVNDYNNFCNILHSFSRVGIVIGAIAYLLYLTFGRELYYDDMNFAYTLCILVCSLIAMSQKTDSVFIIIGFMCMFVAGARGPLVCVLTAMILNIVLNRKSKKTFIYIFIGIVAIVLVQTNLLSVLLNEVGSIFAKFGITNLRILDFYNEGNMADTSGRNDLHEIVIEAILQRPFLGLGVGADRMLLDGSYVHNIVIETISSFGVLFGGLFLFCFAVIIFRTLFSKNANLKIIAFVFLTSIVLKLFFSLSILNCREFSIFLGICISGLIKESRTREIPINNSFAK